MLIRDIAIYYSDMNNVDGYALPKPLDYPDEQAAATRIAMKLNEMAFDVGKFTDLKVNFTPCVPNNTVQHALRTPTSKAAHYVDVGITHEIFEQMKNGDPAAADVIRAGVRRALLVLYGPNHEEREEIRDAIDTAITEGESMEICLMDKQNLFAIGQLRVKYLNSGAYLPRLYVTDRQGNTKLDQDLDMIESLDEIKNFQLGFNKASVHYQYGEHSQDSFPYYKDT